MAADGGATSWNTTATQTLSSTGSFSDSISGLSKGTEYEFRAVGEASDGDLDTGSTLTFTTDSDCVDATLWPSGSDQDGYEHLDQVDLGNGEVVGTSDSANASEDFTCPDVLTIEQGGSFEVAVDYDDGGYDGHFGDIYADCGQEGDSNSYSEPDIFNDVNDDTTTYTATVNVPSDPPAGQTLTRVRLSWIGSNGPDADDENGGVNDFTVEVQQGPADARRDRSRLRRSAALRPRFSNTRRPLFGWPSSRPPERRSTGRSE